MMTFLGISLANVLVKLIFLDPARRCRRPARCRVDDRLPRLFDTTIMRGLIVGLIAIIAVHLMMTRTAFGLRLRTVGANPARGRPCRPCRCRTDRGRLCDVGGA